jgi:hypothetical protein
MTAASPPCAASRALHEQCKKEPDGVNPKLDIETILSRLAADADRIIANLADIDQLAKHGV